MGDENLAAAIAELAASIPVDFSRTGFCSGAARGRFAETNLNKVVLRGLSAGYDAIRLSGGPFFHGSAGVGLPELVTHPAVIGQVREGAARRVTQHAGRESANAI